MFGSKIRKNCKVCYIFGKFSLKIFLNLMEEKHKKEIYLILSTNMAN